MLIKHTSEAAMVVMPIHVLVQHRLLESYGSKDLMRTWQVVNKWITDAVLEFMVMKSDGEVIYGPHDAEPQVWPNLPEATAMLQSFQQLPETMQCKKMMSQETFLEEKLNKALQQYEKLENEVRELYNRTLMYEFMSGRDMDELNFQVARNVYRIAGLRQKVAYERMETIMAAEGSSSEGVKYPPLTNEDYNLDAPVAPYIHEQMMQNQNQTVASSVGYQNQLNASNVNQQIMIQQPVNSYVENQNQMMIVPYVIDQMMHQQAGIGVNLSQLMASNVQIENQAMASNYPLQD